MSTNLKNKIAAFFLRLPLALKITGWYSIFLLLMLLLLSTFIIQFTHIWEDSEIRNDLQSSVVSAADNPKRFRPFHDGIYMILYTPDGVIVKGAVPDGFPMEGAQSPHRITEITVQNATYYYYDAPVRGPLFTGWARGIMPVNTMSRKTNTMLIALIFGGVAFLLIGSYGGYLLIKRGLKPIRLVAHTASEIGSKKDLSKRIPAITQGHDEIQSLTETFNAMLTSLEESSNREKQFSSDVSHELRTPISVIQAESDYGRNYISSLEEAKESFDHIFTQSKFMTSMVSQLLDIARLDNLTDIEMNELDLSELIRETISDYHLVCEKNDREITPSIPDHLPVRGNPMLLKRAIGNLIDNAIKFSNKHIEVGLTRAGGRAEITVTDDGPGIPPKDLNRIWDRLYQTETSRNKANNHGLGLGLYFVKNVVKLHKGAAYAHSTLGQETTFTIELPLGRQ